MCVHMLTAERHGSLCRSTDDQGSAGSPWQHGAAQGGSLSSQLPVTRQAVWVVWCILGHCLASHMTSSVDRLMHFGSLSILSLVTWQTMWIIWCILGCCLSCHLSHDGQCGSFGAFWVADYPVTCHMTDNVDHLVHFGSLSILSLVTWQTMWVIWCIFHTRM